MLDVSVRRAKADDAEALTDLAIRSKASWGYDDSFMEACRVELTITPEAICACEVWVAEVEGLISGMIVLRLGRTGDASELDDFFVSPDFQGQGLGAMLMKRLREICGAEGIRRVGLDADPFAEAFYERFGFRTVGYSPSKSIPDRMLPRMELLLT